MGKKKNDLFSSVMQHGSLTIGTMGVIGIADKMPNSPSKSKIQGGMDNLSILPTVNSMGIAFNSLNSLERIGKKNKRGF